MKNLKVIIFAVALFSCSLILMPGNSVAVEYGVPGISTNGTHQNVGNLYSYIIGNTSETDGFPAYEGPGSGQNQSMPQYIIIAVSPVGNTSAIIKLGNTTEYSGLVNSNGGPWLRNLFVNATGKQLITIEMHSTYLNQTVTDTYQVNFELVATFIHYEQHLHPSTTSTGISGAALVAGGVFGILAVPLGFIHRSGVMIARFRRWFIDRWGN